MQASRQCKAMKNKLIYFSIFIGEKKKLLKAAKTKRFQSIQPWIGVHKSFFLVNDLLAM